MESGAAQSIIPLTIEGLASDGAGVGHHEGYTVFVEQALPGEVVDVVLMERHKRYAKGRVVTRRVTAARRAAPECDLFGRCGGCRLMHLSYEGQLSVKRQRVVDAISRIGKLDGDCVGECRPSPLSLSYRNKIQLPVCQGVEGVAFGLYERNSHDIVAVDRCHIHCDLGDETYRQVRRLLRRHAISAYDATTRRGLLRHLLIKSAVNTGEVLVVLVMAAPGGVAVRRCAEAICEAMPHVKGVVANVQKKDTNTILGEESVVLAGQGLIIEKLSGLSFKVSPASFFQVNPAQAALLYEEAVAGARLTGDETVLDAYCGVGTMSLLMARRAKKVIGVECVSAAIDDARDNAALNGINNCTFFCDAAERFIDTVEAVDVVLLNPPRKGCDAALLKAVERLAPGRVVYVSCDPATMARDLSLLYGGGYVVERVTPFDMFPQTSHVESVAVLARKRAL